MAIRGLVRRRPADRIVVRNWQLLHAVHAGYWLLAAGWKLAGKQLNYFSFILNCEKYVQMLGSQQTLHNDT